MATLHYSVGEGGGWRGNTSPHKGIRYTGGTYHEVQDEAGDRGRGDKPDEVLDEPHLREVVPEDALAHHHQHDRVVRLGACQRTTAANE